MSGCWPLRVNIAARALPAPWPITNDREDPLRGERVEGDRGVTGGDPTGPGGMVEMGDSRIQDRWSVVQPASGIHQRVANVMRVRKALVPVARRAGVARRE
jgi:hypothetical protein